MPSRTTNTREKPEYEVSGDLNATPKCISVSNRDFAYGIISAFLCGLFMGGFFIAFFLHFSVRH
jgi:hypothetical protein